MRARCVRGPAVIVQAVALGECLDRVVKEWIGLAFNYVAWSSSAFYQVLKRDPVAGRWRRVV